MIFVLKFFSLFSCMSHYRSRMHSMRFVGLSTLQVLSRLPLCQISKYLLVGHPSRV
jgi:hypothetical protein